MFTVPGIARFEMADMQEVSVVVWTLTGVRTAELNVRDRSNEEAPVKAVAEIGTTTCARGAPFALAGALIATGAEPTTRFELLVWLGIVPPLSVSETHETDVVAAAAERLWTS